MKGKRPKPRKNVDNLMYECHVLAQNLLYRDDCCATDVKVFAHVISSPNASRRRKVFANNNNRNSIQEEIKSRLKSGNACYYSVQNRLSSSLISKNLKIKIYRTIILPVVLYGCETWSLTLREEHRLSVFENRVLRRILGPKRDEVTWEWSKLHNEELNDLYSFLILFGYKI